MSYTECPHCRNITNNHGAIFSKSVGSPLITCTKCHRQIVDNNMYEWGAIPIESKVYYCLLANNRTLLHWFALILPISLMLDYFWLGVLAMLFVEGVLCGFLYYFVFSYNSDEIDKSINRCKSSRYIVSLVELGYDKVELNLYNNSLEECNTRSSPPKEANLTQTRDKDISNKRTVPKDNIVQSTVPTNSAGTPMHQDISVATKPKIELTELEKCQIALDRWKVRKKDDWEVGIEYERYIGYKLECEGYKVTYTGATQGLNDLGRDLIATKKGISLVIQCKRWSKEKIIHEKHIFQLHGSTSALSLENPDRKYKAVFITTTELSDTAKKYAKIFNITVVEKLPMCEYPLIKCNSNKDGEKIYHLPFDPQYDKIVISKNKESCYAWTTQEAEAKGFRHAHYWRSKRS